MQEMKEGRPPRPWRLPAAALLTLLGGLGLSALLFAGASHLEQKRLELSLVQRAQMRVFALKEGIGHALGGLYAVNQLFASRPAVSRDEYHRFAEPLLARHPYVLGISYIRFVSDAERPALEAELARFRPGAGVTEMRHGRPVPAGRRPQYRVIDYVAPTEGNELALGLDTMYPVKDESARQRAYDTGQPSAGRLISLAQRGGNRVGLVVAMPVYRFGAAPRSVAERRAALVGETSIALLPGEMIAKIFADAGLHGAQATQQRSHPVNVEVYAAAGASADSLVYQSPPLRSEGAGAWLDWLYPAPPQAIDRHVEVAGERWLLRAGGAQHVQPADHLASLAVLALGLVLTALGTAFAAMLSSRHVEVQRRVEEGTAELKSLNKALQLRERAIESSTNSIIIMEAGPGNPVVYVNPAFERSSGYSAAEIMGRNAGILCREDLDQPGLADLRAAISEARDVHAILRNYRKDGTMFWNETYLSPVRDEQGRLTHFVSIQHDMTAMKAYESELLHQSTHDALTGLPNRVLLQDRIAQTIAHSERKGHALWVVSIDLDRFKFTNSRLGHKGGDRLLQVVAARLQSAVRAVDTVARLGGDEFALLLLPEPGAMQPRVEQLQRVLDSLSSRLVLDGAELFMTCSAGIAVYPADSVEPGVLVERADIAMYRAKEMGGNNYQFYTAALNEQLGERLLIESALRTALERREFVLHYQPQVDIEAGRIVGVEALIRWQHPEMGMVAPNRFIPLAEETGLIVPVGAWVLRSACEQLRAWQREGRAQLRVAVNVSARQMAEPDFVSSVAAVLAQTGIAPECLELELTESQVMNDVERAVGVMHELKKLGVKLAIDDFGTGYSSLSHLKRFEVDVLKIDQSFVRDITVDPDDAAIVSTIIALAANLQLQVISEGVETQEQLAFLRRHGCTQMQGYFFGRPLPPAAFGELLDESEAQPALQF
ncbi:bifunctional diguanylate cyclase/phosphodiesterase [Massilia sp. SM-13]|uniref:bifunctional diguanylate cyclase/phosphodiesterase n=1 Tax=Pseudoduganella rhizocola TaxID=3382643 RepID=UPI0038B4A7D3